MYSLPNLGWRPFFQQQLTLEDYDHGYAQRVVGVHRQHVDVINEQGWQRIAMPRHWLQLSEDERPTVGDWLWGERVLERLTLLQRIAAGSEPKPQLLAANVDTLLIMMSCNQDFNIARLRRYLVLAHDAGVMPVIVLTKADLADNPDEFTAQAQEASPNTPVVAINGLDEQAQEALADWLTPGQTLAMLGSSGIGKSTLLNTLASEQVQDTGGIREDDSKGRHTTTSRLMQPLNNGCWMIDTPGMREVRLGDMDVSSGFDHVESLMQQCQFANCHHQGDKGCAVEAALAAGTLDRRDWQQYQKLEREAQYASETEWQKRARYKSFGKMVNEAVGARAEKLGREPAKK